MGDQKAVIVGLSGCSSSGKTTLARLLRDIFPNTFVLHEDDFYRPEEELPTRHGLLDWDCAESLNIPDMEKALTHIRSEGTFPPFVDSKEDKNSVGQCPASEAKIAAMKAKVSAWLEPGKPGHDIFNNDTAASASSSPLRMCLLDGFLLYSPPDFSGIMSLLDIKLFLQVSHAKATQRREARDGYVTLEGFWKDPPGYVDKIVWPNYVDAHAWMFEGGDVEGGRLAWDVLREKGVLAQQSSEAKEGGGRSVDFDFEETLEWAVEQVMGALEGWHARK
ncbi:P-loop containing nucleoside triphosphate hydrolase protein [Cryphonectria parasitica EP155]|uniref:P-loop containing nucleoside triphosphate hydrolase protein n=1 Tax=Cryphonectria parasitica (strain ATCC 38755 / EP155) TaxID=660469 RepID=A0A9P5CQI8_CRYP1|nr:P-loop containing nucleoside triphosphate hydrolase protein [Cryphonectria parasitica EP155]KAF3766502.1 P-loop containing nucleoside triphosphate hydrolase protein [Cryphonectria parasitica EP155]